tara:strand:- start:328 stop:723 length:396 start_codon:yes stop_codon:yes gene_type:complete
MIKKQYYLNILTAGIRSDVERRSITDSEMKLKDIVKEILNKPYAYGFYYSFKEYVKEADKKFFAEEEIDLPFNFIDPVSIGECLINKGMYRVTIRKEWAQYNCEVFDNIIFSSDEIEKSFEGKNPLRVIRY